MWQKQYKKTQADVTLAFDDTMVSEEAQTKEGGLSVGKREIRGVVPYSVLAARHRRQQIHSR